MKNDWESLVLTKVCITVKKKQREGPYCSHKISRKSKLVNEKDGANVLIRPNHTS